MQLKLENGTQKHRKSWASVAHYGHMMMHWGLLVYLKSRVQAQEQDWTSGIM